MRGRTNASNGGIFLNATTENLEVSTGNIVAGDFVERVYNTGTTPLNVSTAYKDAILVDASTNLYITLVNGLVNLFTYINGVITFVDSYIDKSYTELFKYNATTYITNYGDVFTVDIVNQELTLTSASSSDKQIVGTYGDFVIGYYSYTSSGYFTQYLYVYSYPDFTLIDQVSIGQTSSGSSGSTYQQHNRTYGSYASGFFVADARNTGRQYIYGQIDLYPIDSTGHFDTVVNIYLYTYTSYQSTTNTGTVRLLHRDNGRYIPVHYIPVGSSEKTVLVDTVSTNKINIPISYSAYNCSGFNASNKFLLSALNGSTVYFYWAELDSQTQQVTILDTKYNDNYAYTFWEFINDKFCYLKTITSIVNYSNIGVASDSLVIGTPTNTVKEWAGSGNPMGVAKQSGTAGDTIEVYIPQVNS